MNDTTRTTVAAGTFGALAGAGVVAEATTLPLLFAVLLVAAFVALAFATWAISTAVFGRGRRPVSVRRALRSNA